MTKSQLVTLIAPQLKLTRKDAETAVDSVFDSIASSLESGRRVELRGFGSFGLKERRERADRNPKTGESVVVEAKRVMYFIRRGRNCGSGWVMNCGNRISQGIHNALRVMLCVCAWCSGPLHAESQIVFDLPVMCAMGEQCVIQNHVDRDPGSEHMDYQCGSLSYDGHRGTDFRVKTFRAMREGVVVVAAAAGKVKAIRDHVEDGPPSGQVDREKVRDHMAGNGVVLDHGNGWETQYSHLRNGSVLVELGHHLRAGQPLGLIGQSGLAEFPHLHFEVRRRGKAVDPFDVAQLPICGMQHTSIWSAEASKNLAYLAVGELSSGFSTHVPDNDYLADPPSLAPTIWPADPVLIFWVNLFGVRKHDRETIRLLDPVGHVIAEHSTIHTKHQARSMRYIGKRASSDTNRWSAGTYVGEYTLVRAGSDQPILHISRQLKIPE